MEGKFDIWIDQARKRGVGIEAKQREIAASVIGTPPGTTSFGINLWGPDAIRFARFQNGAEVGIKVNPAVIEDGAMVRPAGIEMEVARKGRAITVWSATMQEKSYAVVNSLPSVFRYGGYEGNASIPIEDKQLLNTMNVSLNEVMAYVLESGMDGSEP